MSYKSIIRGLCIFLVWTVASFLCHQTAKYFLLNGMTYLRGHGLFLSIILTLSQFLACVSSVDMQYKKDKIFYTIVLAHIAATFATNCSMTFMYASSTFAIKLMEPITSAIVQSLVLSTSISRSTLISLPLIVSGAVVFARNPFTTSSISIGVILAFSSNVILAIRNVAMKLKQNKPTEIRFRPAVFRYSVVVCAAISTVVAYLMESREILPQKTTLTVAMMLTSSMFHVIYSYVSTNVVLHYMTVVSHAVSNILKRIIVVLLLYLFGQRHATPWNFAGLVVCLLGLLIFVRGKLTRNNPLKKYINREVSRSKNYPFQMAVLIVLTISIITVTGNLGDTSGIFKDIQKENSRIRFLETFKEKTFGTESLKLMDQTQLFPDLEARYLAENKNKMEDFLKWRLLDHGHETNLLAPLLPTSIEIIREAQRVHFNLFQDLIGKFKYAMLFDVATYENKGDPAIAAGEVYLLRRLGIKVVYYCNTFKCMEENTQDYAGNLSKLYSKDELVILFQGGGNLVGYPTNDILREDLFRRFIGFKMVIFSQSIFLPNNIDEGTPFVPNNIDEGTPFVPNNIDEGTQFVPNNIDEGTQFVPNNIDEGTQFVPNNIDEGTQFVPNKTDEETHFDRCKRLYCCNPNLTIVLRDKQSLEIALKYWNNGTRLIMAPDMVFQIGPIRRFMSPAFDIMWVKRNDSEAPTYTNNERIAQQNVSVNISDWWTWKTPQGSTSMETAFLMMNNGLVFLQRGRVVITDRLHGHILSTLLNIPHVLIDNKYKKLSSYHNTWTRSLDNVLITNDSSKAFGLAMTLLEKYKTKLTPIAPFMEVNENHVYKSNMKSKD